MTPSRHEIILIGSDPSLSYLISRFADQCGCSVTVHKVVPTPKEIWARIPDLVLFSSVENLETAQELVDVLAGAEIPIGVCASTGDEPRARQLGADHCLLHPLTYDGFLSALLRNGTAGVPRSGKDGL